MSAEVIEVKENVETESQGSEAADAVLALLALGISIEEIALDLGVSARTVWRWKSGETDPYSSFQKKLAIMLTKERKKEEKKNPSQESNHV